MPDFVAESIDGFVALEAETLPEAMREVLKANWSVLELPMFSTGIPIFAIGEDGAREQVATVDLYEFDASILEDGEFAGCEFG